MGSHSAVTSDCSYGSLESKAEKRGGGGRQSERKALIENWYQRKMTKSKETSIQGLKQQRRGGGFRLARVQQAETKLLTEKLSFPVL